MISQTVEYALRAIVYLSGIPAERAASSGEIATAMQVPQGYLSKLLRDLVVAGLVTSRRGPNGGFSLAQPASSMSMLDVVNAVDPIRRIRKCPLGNPAHLNLCPLHKRMDDALAQIEDAFGRTSIAEVSSTNDVARGQCPAMQPTTMRIADVG